MVVAIINVATGLQRCSFQYKTYPELPSKHLFSTATLFYNQTIPSGERDKSVKLLPGWLVLTSSAIGQIQQNYGIPSSEGYWGELVEIWAMFRVQSSEFVKMFEINVSLFSIFHLWCQWTDRKSKLIFCWEILQSDGHISFKWKCDINVTSDINVPSTINIRGKNETQNSPRKTYSKLYIL